MRTHLKALETRKQPQERLKWKFSLFKALHQAGYSRKDILALFHFIDWMLNLPKEIEQQFNLKVSEYEEHKKMRYVTSIERMGEERGLQQGLQQGLEKAQKALHENVVAVLQARFQQIPETVVQTVQKIDDLSVLSLLIKQAALAESLSAFERVLIEKSE